MEQKVLTIGYIGNGKSTNRYHVPYVLQRKDKIKIKMIYARDLTKQTWPTIPDVEYTDKLDKILQDPEIQLISINTPAQHFELAQKVLNSGKNCLVEKPFVDTKVQAEKLFRLAKDKGLLLEVYQNRRFDSDFLTAQKVIESGKLGDLLEMEMSFDYYRPYIPERSKSFKFNHSFLYGHGCHTLDQVISYFGKPDSVHYDVKQILGQGRNADYFDIDLYYGSFKISVKSSFFRVKRRPIFTIYGKKGMFIKEKCDRQEEHLKLFYMPGNEGFGIDSQEDYGTIVYYDNDGKYHEEKVVSEVGDYGRYYDALYDSLIYNKEPLVKPEESILVMSLLENGVKGLS